MRKPRLSKRLQGMEIAMHSKGDWNPLDGGTPANDPSNPISWMVGPTMGYTNLLPGGPMGFGSSLFAQPPAPGQGGGDGGAAMAQIQAALAQADAAKYTADQQLKLGQAGIDAQLQMANQSMIGGIVSSALASQKSNIVRKEMMPHEEGAAQIASLDMAAKWDKTLQMRIAGYSDVAINHELGGRGWKPLFRDAEWNAMNMMKMTKQDVMQNAQLFGFKSPTNPNGIAMSEEEYMGMMSMKDPSELLKVDPQVAAQRNAEYKAFKEKAYAEGNDLMIMMFENPQLSGASILGMKGKEALIDPRLAPLLQNMNQVKEPYDDLDSQLQAYDASSKPKEKIMSDGQKVWVDGNGNPFGPKPAQGDKGGKYSLGGSFGYNEAMEMYNAGRQKIIDEHNRKQSDYQQNLENKFKWDDAINALTKGEKNQYTDQINKMVEMGVIDRETGRVNGGALSKLFPPGFLQAPEFSMYRDLSEQEKNGIRDEYKRLGELNIDPKLVRTESMGGGITRKILLNKDGTRAASALEGYVTDATGQQRFMSMSGHRTQDFADRAGMISGYSPTSSGHFAGVDSDTMGGKLEMRSDDNYLAQFNTGQKTKTMSASKQPTGTTNMPPKPAAPAKLSMPSNPAASAGGAPLAAGE